MSSLEHWAPLGEHLALIHAACSFRRPEIHLLTGKESNGCKRTNAAHFVLLSVIAHGKLQGIIIHDLVRWRPINKGDNASIADG